MTNVWPTQHALAHDIVRVFRQRDTEGLSVHLKSSLTRSVKQYWPSAALSCIRRREDEVQARSVPEEEESDGKRQMMRACM